jgi:hypothetical protein
MKGLYHAQRGCDEIQRPYLSYQRKQVNDGVWRPVVAFLLFVIWGSFLIVSVCDWLGVK